MAGCRRRPARLGHLARRALLRLRDPRRARQVFLRLAGCADRLPVQLPGVVRSARHRLRCVPARRQQRRAAPLHRQGHRQLPRPVLAGGAARQRPPRTDAPARQRLPDRGRREDEQVARHLRDGAHLPRCRARSGSAALLLRLQDLGWRGRSRPQPGRFQRAGEQRHRRQVRQPGQPLRRLHRQALRRKTRRQPARCRAIRPFRCRARRRARGLRAQ